MTPIFKGKAKSGQLFLNDPSSFRKYLLRFKKNTEVDITVEKTRPINESLESDRKYYWAVVADMISQEVGHSKEVVHESMKIRYASYTDEKTKLTIVKSVFSNHTDLSDIKRKKFIRNVRDWASDFLNLDIPEKQRVNYD